MRFLLDNNLSPRLAAALNELSNDEVAHLRRKFQPNTPDVEWITALGEEGDWTIVSGDLRISKNKVEVDAWLESGCTAFFLEKGWANLVFWEKAHRLIKYWPMITTTANTIAGPIGYRVPLSGKLKAITS